MEKKMCQKCGAISDSAVRFCSRCGSAEFTDVTQGAPQQNFAPAGAPYEPQPRRKMVKFPIEKRDFRMTLCVILWTYLAFLLTLENGLALGFMITYLTGFILFSAYFFQKGKSVLRPFETVCGLLAVCAAPAFMLTDTGVKVLLMFVAYICSVVWFGSLCAKKEGPTDAALIPYVFKSVFFNAFGALARTMASLFSGNGESKSRRAWLWKALIGLAVSLPVAGIMVLLLTSADQAFSDLVWRIVDTLGEQIGRIFLALVFSPFVLAFVIGLKKKEQPAAKPERTGGIEFPYVTAFLGLVSAVYLLYLFSQLAYFFNGFAGILPGGILPADYARRGFFELCAIAAINFVILFLVLLFTKKKDGKLPAPVKWESTFICLFTVMLIATVFAKMFLYVQRFGLSQDRIYPIAFMLFMAILFLALLARLFVRGVRVLRIGTVAAMCILMALCFCRVDYQVARYNIWAYQTGKLSTLDLEFIDYRCGDGGIQALYEMYNSNDARLSEKRNTVKRILSKKAQSRMYVENGEVKPYDTTKWGAWILEESRADDILRNFREK